MSNNENQIGPENHPELYTKLVLMTAGEVFGVLTYHSVHLAHLIVALTSPNVTALQIPMDSLDPEIMSVWDGNNFVAPQ